jgi:GNAT superfamily N-acetyltransferase
MGLTIKEVLTAKDKKKFISFPHDLYVHDPNYVPELNSSVQDILNPKKNAFFEHSEATLFLAVQDNKTVGRIAAIRNNNYNKYHQSNVGFFGFFDVTDQYEVAEILLNQAFTWCKNHGFDRVLGPVNFTTNDTAGLLIDGYDSPPLVLMTYNKPYYLDFLTRFGFSKEIDLSAVLFDRRINYDKPLKVAALLKERLQSHGFVFRNINMKTIGQEIAQVISIYNAAWENNWGFVPPTPNETRHLVKNLVQICDPQYVYLVEDKGKLIGFALGVPNINEKLIKIKRGRLFPFGIFRLLRGFKKNKMVRIILLGVLPEYRKKGIESVLYAGFIRDGYRNNLDAIEASWILENNTLMNSAMDKIGGFRYKTYRIFSMAISHTAGGVMNG